MTSTDRPTLKSVTERIEAVEARLSTVRETDPEARALSRCAQALDELSRADRASSANSGYLSSPSFGGNYGGGYNYQPLWSPPDGPVPRVLDHLRQRFGISDPASEASRLSAELNRAYQRITELEGRLQQISGAVSA